MQYSDESVTKNNQPLKINWPSERNMPNTNVEINTTTKNEKSQQEKIIYFFSVLIIFVVNLFSDLQSKIGLMSSVFAGLLYGSTNFFDQKLMLDYTAYGNANITSNGTLTTSAEDRYTQDYPLINQRNYFKSAQGTHSYYTKEVLDTNLIIKINWYLFISGLLNTASGKLIRSCTTSLKSAHNHDKSKSYQSYILSVIDGCTDSLQTAFLTYLTISMVGSVLLPPETFYNHTISSNHSSNSINSTDNMKDGVTRSFTTNYTNTFLNSFQVNSLFDDSNSLIIKSDVSITIMLDMLFRYVATLSITNQAEPPELSIAITGVTLLFILGRLIKNYKENLAITQQIATNDNHLATQPAPEIIIPTPRDEIEAPGV